MRKLVVRLDENGVMEEDDVMWWVLEVIDLRPH